MNALRISRQDLDDESSQQVDFQKHQQIVFRSPLQQTTNLYRPQQQSQLRQRNQSMKLNKNSDRYQRPDIISNYQADIENASEICNEQIDSHQVTFLIVIQSTLSQPQIIDQDVEDFTRRLDMSIMAFRSQSLKDFMKIKRHLLREQAEKINYEKSKCDAMLTAKQNQIEQLKEELAHAYKQIQNFDIKTNSLSTLTGKVKRNQRQMSLIMKLILRWRLWTQRKKGNRFRIQNFTPRKKYLDTKILFSQWTRYYRKNKNRIQTQQWEQKMKNRVGEITMKYSKQIDSLKAALDETQKKLAAEQRKSLNVIDSLKKSMMRGMCAINFEAMNILDPNLQSDNVSNNLANQQQNSQMSQNLLLQHQQPSSNQSSIILPPANSASQFDILGMNGITSTPQRSNASQSNIMTPNLEVKQQQNQSETFRTDPSTQIPSISNQGGNFLLNQQKKPPQFIQGSLKIESKDHRWQPAPILGKTFTGMQLNPTGTFGKDQNISFQTMGNNNIPQTKVVYRPEFQQEQFSYNAANFNSNKYYSTNNDQPNSANNMFTSHTVDQLLEMRRPKTSVPQINQQLPILSNVYTPKIEIDNAVSPMHSIGTASQLPLVGISNQNQPAQSSGKTIRVNGKGKSYLIQGKKTDIQSKIGQSQQRPSSSRGVPKKGNLKK